MKTIEKRIYRNPKSPHDGRECRVIGRHDETQLLVEVIYPDKVVQTLAEHNQVFEIEAEPDAETKQQSLF